METLQSADAELLQKLVFLNTLTTTPHQQEWRTYTTAKPVYMEYKTAERLVVREKCMGKKQKFWGIAEISECLSRGDDVQL